MSVTLRVKLIRGLRPGRVIPSEAGNLAVPRCGLREMGEIHAALGMPHYYGFNE